MVHKPPANAHANQECGLETLTIDDNASGAIRK